MAANVGLPWLFPPLIRIGPENTGPSFINNFLKILMTEASARDPRQALRTPASLKFPSKSTKKRYSKPFSGIGLDSIIIILTLLKMKFPENVVKRSALVRDLKRHTDLSGFLCVDRLFPEDQEACRISLYVIDLLREDLPFRRAPAVRLATAAWDGSSMTFFRGNGCV